MGNDTRIKRIGRATGRGAIVALQALARRLSLRACQALGAGLGDLMRRGSRRRYSVALKNLKIAFGDALSDAERERIARESFRSFGRFAMESMKLGFVSDEEFDRLVVCSDEVRKVSEAAFARGKGCIAITAHLGNFEVSGRWVSRQHEIIVLVREARDRGTTELMTRSRERMGLKVVTLKQSLRPVLSGLKRNAMVAILCDQNATDVFVPFFGRTTGTVDGPARLALRTGATIAVGCCVRRADGRFEMDTEGLLIPESTGDEQADVARIMTEVNARLEKMIRKYPEQWLWFHDRWKSSPPPTDESVTG